MVQVPWIYLGCDPVSEIYRCRLLYGGSHRPILSPLKKASSETYMGTLFSACP